MEIQLWRELLDPYQLAVDELTVKFHHIIEEHRNQGLYSPIESVDGRVKSIVSILDKMQRKNVSMNDIEKKIEDLAGIRIICQFVEDIDRVVNLIKNRTDMKVKCEKDYVSHMKTSGYRSYHMIILYTVNTIHGPKELSAEIQIRTMAMDFWASLEHKIYYKFEGNAPDYISRDLRECSGIVSMLDAKMLQLNEAILEAKAAQEEQEGDTGAV